MDDDALLLRSLQRLLCHDFDVVVAVSGERAIEIVTADGRFDAVVCDFCLGEMNGLDLCDELPKHLGSRVLFMSGGASSRRARIFADEHPERVLVKPAKPDTLRAAIWRIVSEARR